MSQVLVNIRMEEELKKGMEQICNELGMNVTTAFTIFAKKMTREKRIPFEVSIDPFYSQNNVKAIDKPVKEIPQEKVIVKIKDESEEIRKKSVTDG